MKTQLRILTDREFQLAENPLWDAPRERLLWTDIDAGELWTCRPGENRPEPIYHGPRVGGFTIQEDGCLLLFRESDVALLDDQGNINSALPFEESGCERFNDVIAAPDGSVFAGAIGSADNSGGLFHLSTTGDLRLLFRGTRIPNGMAFSLDRKFFYYTCSTSGTISRFALEPGRSAISERAIIHTASPVQGTPDGLTIDNSGSLWSARWGGGKVLRLGSDGQVVDEIEVPTPNVTSVTFGGREQSTLFITTAGGPVYACEPGVSGPPDSLSRIRTDG